MVVAEGIEPSATRLSTTCSTAELYDQEKMASPTRFELWHAYSVKGRHARPLHYGDVKTEKLGAGEGSRTLVSGLGSPHSHPSNHTREATVSAISE